MDLRTGEEDFDTKGLETCFKEDFGRDCRSRLGDILCDIEGSRISGRFKAIGEVSSDSNARIPGFDGDEGFMSGVSEM